MLGSDKTVAIVIARMGSTRLPGKVLKPLAGQPVLRWSTAAAVAAPGVDEVWVATSTLPADDAIVEWCQRSGIKCFRGSETDVLSRFAGAARAAEADVAVRITGDCPFVDPFVIGQVVALRKALKVSIACNIDPPTWPDGLDCEAIDALSLLTAESVAIRPSDRDTVTQYLYRTRGSFSVANLSCPIPDLHKERWVLDTEADYELCQKIAEEVGPLPTYLDILAFLDKNPELREINAHHPRNERFFEAIKNEEVSRDHTLSQAMLKRVREIIPLGTQTFSKSYKQYPQEAPLYVTHGDGGRVFDVDGNEYVDLVGGLLPNILGYRDPDVDFAIRRQLDSGISFSLASTLECQLAEKLQNLIPCAQMVRFGKNGTDVTTAAIRLARYCTGRSRVLTAGYHGWADWSIVHDPVRNSGVPAAVGKDTIVFSHGDIAAARQHLDTQDFACVIVEPETDPEFLLNLRLLCNATGTLLIFDEIITGFRFHLGGAQALYGVTPDLATFGKAMGNGAPISALVGLSEYMRHMEDICFSGTMFGDALALAAALATLEKLEHCNVLEKIQADNRLLHTGVALAQSKNDIHVLDVVGGKLPRLSFLGVNECTKDDIKTLFIQEMISNGILIIASHNCCFAHSGCDIERIVMAYDKTFQVMRRAIESGHLKDWIHGASIAPTANVRYAS